MKRDAPTTPRFRDPAAKLSSALKILEQFTAENGTKPISHAHHETSGNTIFNKIARFATCHIGEAFSERIRKKNEQERRQAEETLLTAIDDVKRYHPLVAEKDSLEGKHLASRALVAIEHFNHLVETGEQPATSWHKRLLRFLIKRSRPTLPQTRVIVISSREQPSTSKVASLAHLREFGMHLSEREVDAFRMKGFSLMQKEGLSFPSIRDALSSLRASPIYTTQAKDASEQGVPAESIIHLEQTLTPFPGETLILRGAFRRVPSTLTPSTPIPGSFELDRKTVQTGFPYPSQHAGWALAAALIPPAPLRPEKLKRTPILLRAQKKIAHALSEQTPYLTKAKELLKQQSEAIHSDPATFLSLHKQLCSTILSAAPHALTAQSDIDCLNTYFDSLKEPAQISHDYEEINKRFITLPYEALRNAWSQQSSLELLSHDPKLAFGTAKKIVGEALEMSLRELEGAPPERKNFLQVIGRALGAAGSNIFLQHVSEIIEFAPPQLSDFEKKLQSALYLQQELFIRSLESPLSQDPFEELRHRLLVDIHIFTPKGPLHPIVDELDKYYTARFVNSPRA